MNISVKIDDNGLGLRLARWEKAADSFERAWPKVEKRFNFAMREQFASEGTRGGSRWQPLTSKYKKWKAAHHPGKPILQLHGDLYRSLTGRTTDTAYNVTRKTWQKATTVIYARRQNAKRPIIQMTEADAKAFTTIINDEVQRQINEAGL